MKNPKWNLSSVPLILKKPCLSHLMAYRALCAKELAHKKLSWSLVNAFQKYTTNFRDGRQIIKASIEVEAQKTIHNATLEKKLVFLAKDITNAKKLSSETLNTLLDMIDDYFNGMNSFVDEVVRESDDQMDESPAQGIRQQNLAASDVAFSIKEKKDKVLTSIVEAKQITRTLSNLAYTKWENFQASKSARKALTIENLKVKEEIEEAFKRKNNDDRNSTPISTMEVNRRVDMLIKAMEDLVFRENTKTPKKGPATQDARRRPRKGRDDDRRHTQKKSPVAHSRKNQKSGRSNTPTSTKSSKGTRSPASMKSAGDKKKRSTENKNKTNKKQRRRTDQKNGGASNAKH